MMSTSPSTNDASTDLAKDLMIQARRWADRGYRYQQRSEFTKAVIAYSEAIQLLPSLDDVYAYRAACYYQLGDYHSAVVDFSVALTVQPNDLMLYRKRALVYIQLEQWASAIRDFETVQRGSPPTWQDSCRLPHASALYHLGVEQARDGQLDAAIARLTESIQMAPEASNGIMPRLQVLHQRRIARDREAEDKFQRQRQDEARRQSQIEAERQRELAARRQAEIEAYVHNNRALEYLQQGEYDLALAKFSEALRYDPNLIDAHVNRAEVLFIKAQQFRTERLRQNGALELNDLMHIQHLLHAALDSYNRALQAGLEFMAIHTVRSTTRRALIDVERDIEQWGKPGLSPRLPDDEDTDQVIVQP